MERVMTVGGGAGLPPMHRGQHLGGRGRQISEFEASLVYKVSSRTAKTIQRNPVSKNQKKKEKKKKKKKTIKPAAALGSGPCTSPEQHSRAGPSGSGVCL
jgi:hypothetical protein